MKCYFTCVSSEVSSCSARFIHSFIFKHIFKVSNNGKPWKAWLNLDAPEEGNIPDGYNSQDVFNKLLLIRLNLQKIWDYYRPTLPHVQIFIIIFFERSWCPDRTLAQARKYVRKAMGTRFAEPVLLNLHATWEESDTRTPLICFLSMGSDPTDQIEALAKNLELGET